LGAKVDITQLRGVRGERFRLYAPNASLNRPVRLMHPRYHIYLVPRPNNQFVLGASEIESDDMSPISVRSTLELLSAAYSVDPAFGEARIIESVVNCRPALPDNEPRIYFQPGLMRINGLYRNGYLVAPAVAENALALLHEQPLTFPEIVSRNCEER
jgi:glycine oxidase